MVERLLTHRIVIALSWVGLAYAVALGLWFKIPLFSGLFLVFCGVAGWKAGHYWEKREERR